MEKEFKPNKDKKTELQEEAVLKKVLEPLKMLKIPAGLRKTNQERIQDSLNQKAKSFRVPWWRRRIGVPLPAAAGFVIILGVLSLLQISRFDAYQEGNKPIEQMIPVEETRFNTEKAQKQEERFYYYETANYVAGLGFVERERGRIFIRENHHDN